jgi:hypothetical protein
MPVALLRIPDPDFSIPYPATKRFRSRIWILIKNLSIFNPKNGFLAVEKMIWNVHPGSGFFPIPAPDQKSTGSGSATLASTPAG